MSRHTTGVLLIHCCLLCAPSAQTRAEETRGPVVCMSAEQLRDKIRGGLLGQMLGNLNGLPHEFKYIKEPGNVTTYTPALPRGARTDDDTDFEWVYIVEMQRRGTVYLSPGQIAELWRSRINRRIWCSNQYARQLMDLGLEPPLTGRVALNPWAEFNISGQFLCETFGLLAPAMPQTAARIGLNYTTVAIDMEPAQTTQLFHHDDCHGLRRRRHRPYPRRGLGGGRSAQRVARDRRGPAHDGTRSTRTTGEPRGDY